MENGKIDDRKILIIMLGLILMLFAHNIFLQTRVNKAIDYASDAEREARMAKDYANDAADNAFGNVCRYCP